MKEEAKLYFESGCHCSESIVKAAIAKGLCPKELLNASYAFAGGMGSGCLCGAIAGSQMVLGSIYTKEGAKAAAKNFIDKFRENHKATCCRVLSVGLEGMEKRKHCAELVFDCAEILESMLAEKITK